MGTASIPGTGLSYRHYFRDSSPDPRDAYQIPETNVPVQPGHGFVSPPPPYSALTDSNVTQIRSASTETLQSGSMADFQNLLEKTYEERMALHGELASAEREADTAAKRYHSWENGLLFKRIFTTEFAIRKEIFETQQAKLDPLREQLRLTALATHIDIDPKQAEPYCRMRDDFARLCECQRAWDTLDRRTINCVVERSVASEAITRAPVSFELGSCDLIEWEQKPLHLPNRTGGDLYIYPGFALYRAAKQSFAVIDLREIELLYVRTRFVEEDAIPSDAQIVGQAWAKSNKDGSPDRRFGNNYQIPIVLYGSLRFTSPTGLHEEFQVSNAELAERFSQSWHTFQASLAPTSSPGLRAVRSIDDSSGNEKFDLARAFANESDKARKLAFEQADFWMFALSEELLRSKLEALESEYAMFDQILLSMPKRAFTGQNFVPWIGPKLNEIKPLVDEIVKCFENDLRESWGKPGESADPVQILKAINRLVGFCRVFLTWELEVCSTEPPGKMRRLRDSLRGITGWVIGDVKRGANELARAIADVRGGSKEFRARMDFSSPPPVMRFKAEMDEINKNPSRYLSETLSPRTTETGAETSPYCFHSMGSRSDRVRAAQLFETICIQQMGCPHKVELMGPDSTMLNILCPEPTPLALTFENAPRTLIRKLKDAGFTAIIFSDQNGQSVKVADLTKYPTTTR